jgi:FAD-dependent urate hydroxylase
VSKDSVLSDLESRLRDDLVALAFPDIDWVRPVTTPDGEPALNCAVIGAGQMGMTIAAGLKRERVSAVAVFDSEPPGREGPWLTFGRMQTLRTPKHLTGPDLGLPSLGFRAWWIARHGAAAWESMSRIPRTAWMEYLVWYRQVMGLDVRNHHALRAIAPVGHNMFRLEFATPAGPSHVHARVVVLATGTEGGGGRAIPEVISQSVPQHLRAHTNDDIDVAAARGKRVGILGSGASAFDLAIAMLEAGAASVDVCFRRPAMPDENPRRWMETPGFLAHYPSLPDARKWGYLHRLYTIGQPPPLPTFERAMALPGFRLNPGTPWDRCVSDDGATVTVTSGDRRFTFDFIVAGTGIAADLAMRPELDAFRDKIALWGDRYTPEPGQAHPVLARFPYLGDHGTFTEKEPGTAPFLSRIHFLARPATLSLGPVAASNSALKYVGPRVVRGVTRTLMLDQADSDWNEFIGRRHQEIAVPKRQPRS